IFGTSRKPAAITRRPGTGSRFPTLCSAGPARRATPARRPQSLEPHFRRSTTCTSRLHRGEQQCDASNRVPLVLMGTAIKPTAKGQRMMMTTRKLSLSSSLLVFLASSLATASAFGQTPAPAPAAPPPAAPPPAAEAPPPPAPPPAPEKKKTGSGPGLSLSPDTPQVGGRVSSPAEPP